MSSKPITPNAGRWFACLGLACLAVAAHWAMPAAGQKEPAGAAAQPLAGAAKAQVPQKAGALPALLKARLDAAQKAYGQAMAGLGEVKRIGANVNVLQAKPEEVYTWSVRWLNAQLDMSDQKDKHHAALEAHFKRMKELQTKVAQLSPELLPPIETSAAAWYLAEAEVWLAQEKAK
jgi:hypothetical protein